MRLVPNLSAVILAKEEPFEGGGFNDGFGDAHGK